VVVIAPSSQHLVLRAQTAPGPGVAPTTRFHIRANSADGTVSSTTAPATGAVLDLPVKVDTGLNRIWIDLEGPAGAATEKLYLGTMVLVPARH
jgi:hypothetical protein